MAYWFSCLPKHISEEKVINAIDPSKDVDGFHPVNAGKMVQGLPTFIPATPHGIMLLLEHYKIDTKGMHAVVVGRSNIVGRPMSILLSSNQIPAIARLPSAIRIQKTLTQICLQADIIVAALGKPEFVNGDMVKEGAIVIDVGITRVQMQPKKEVLPLKEMWILIKFSQMQLYYTSSGGCGADDHCGFDEEYF